VALLPEPVAIRRVAFLWPAAVAASLALVAALLQLRGVDLAAQVYRVGLFRREGFTLWDSQWYGGHWTLGYSVLFLPLAALLGLGVTAVLTAAGAAVAFDRLAVAHFGPAGRIGSGVFAVGTLAQVASAPAEPPPDGSTGREERAKDKCGVQVSAR
jgi:hypothetical protein